MIKFNVLKQNYSGIVIRVINSALQHLISVNKIVAKDKQQKINEAVMSGDPLGSIDDKSDSFKVMNEKKKSYFNNLNKRGFSFSKITRKTPHLYPKVKKDEM